MKVILRTFIAASLCISPVYAETFDLYGAVAFLSLSKGLTPKTSLNFYHSDTYGFSNKTFNGKQYDSGDLQTYFQTSLNYKWHPNINLTIGHIYQRNNPLDADFTNENRAFEQATFSHARNEIQITHRLRFEQRFINERDSYEFKTRLRYQIGASLPLQGRQLDPGEWYFNCYNEFYFSTSGERNAFYSDDWVYAGVGYQTIDWGKLEIGPVAQYSVINLEKDIKGFYALQFGWILKYK
jgi:hypothetical protein